MTDNIVDSLVEIPNKISCHASQVSATLNLQIGGFLIRMIVALLIDGKDWLTILIENEDSLCHVADQK